MKNIFLIFTIIIITTACQDKAVRYHSSGDQKAELEKYFAAIDDYNKAIELDSNYAYAYFSRGLAKRKLGDNKGAIADYTKAIELNPNRRIATNYYNNRGIAKVIIDDYKESIADFNDAIELDSNNVYARR